jgi:UDP-N-acetylmuramate dehydrogenase
MQISTQASLKPYHTFAIEQQCDVLVTVDTLEELIQVYQHPEWTSLPKLLLGKGSNMLFTEHFHGVVIINRLLGREVEERDDAYLLHIAGGEDWPELVAWSVQSGYGGLENLALIPGCAGSAPIQNIGAYGVEFKDVCEYVEVLDLGDFSQRRLSREQCEFGYRDSVFKRALQGKVAITAVGLRLVKEWQPNVSYGPLQALAESERTAENIFDTVCRIRMEKLPDPAVNGNAGSFFKNPLISAEHLARLKADYPGIVAYRAGKQFKVAAGWLIDQCGLKGQVQGGAQVHPNQALVLVNRDKATADDVLSLAASICQAVYQRYQICLEHEVRFMAAQHETTLAEIKAAEIKQGKA